MCCNAVVPLCCVRWGLCLLKTTTNPFLLHVYAGKSGTGDNMEVSNDVP